MILIWQTLKQINLELSSPFYDFWNVRLLLRPTCSCSKFLKPTHVVNRKFPSWEHCTQDHISMHDHKCLGVESLKGLKVSNWQHINTFWKVKLHSSQPWKPFLTLHIQHHLMGFSDHPNQGTLSESPPMAKHSCVAFVSARSIRPKFNEVSQ